MSNPEIIALKRPKPAPPAAAKDSTPAPAPAPAEAPAPAASKPTRKPIPKPSKPIPAKVITSAENEQGQTFRVGDSIEIFTGAKAVISGFSTGAGGHLYALYVVPDDPNIERGVSRVECLKS
ncbi:MAG: hypothetical protein F6J93_01055 [Oscillatoria sp. SIO1A7]|nr:hypothetical protein [Oscillatoria sp. SIO1A7]